MARKSTQSANTGKTQKKDERVPLRNASGKGGAERGSAKGNRKAASPQQPGPELSSPRIFDERTKRDIVGVVFGVVAVALLIMAFTDPSGIVSSVVSDFLHNLLGVGLYILPFLLMVIGASFIVRTDKPFVALRICVGSAMVFIALLGFLSTFISGADADLSLLFEPESLRSRGGWIGSGIAWVLMELFDLPVTCVLLAGLAAGGAVVIGFSISGAIERTREKTEDRRRERQERREAEVDAFSSDEAFGTVSAMPPKSPSPRIRRNVIPDVPRDLSRPRRASSSLSTQLIDAAGNVRLSAGEDVQSGPEASDVGMYWPDEYAFDSKTAVIGEEPSEAAPAASITRKLNRRKESVQGQADGDSRDLSAEPKASKSKAKGRKTAKPSGEPEVRDGFALPPVDFLNRTVRENANRASEKELRETAMLLQETLTDFNIMASVVGWVAGPTVTLFKVDLPSGVRVNKVTVLTDDIALALAAPGVRIFAPIPGTNYVGIEVPNRVRENVLLGDIITEAHGAPLEMAIGKDVEGHAIITDLAKMPHLLIGGTTGSGKSVAINSMIMSILMRSTPDEVRFIMIDPKRVEFTPYNGIPHLYVPVVTENKEAASALAWGVAEMERRLKVLSKHAVRNISQYNAKVASGELDSEDADEPAKKMPYIVIVIDELADLMMNVGKEVEFSISRIAQLARAAGIHLIVATQRPSTNVVTGLIKANITNRIAFNVASGIDSRVILDSPGAENLIGLGDMLFSKPEYAKPQRLQGCYVSEDEIEAVVEFLKEQGEPEYHQEILKTNLITQGASAPDGSGGTSSADDPLLWEAAEIVVSSGLGSTSNIQRRLSVGYSRAGRIMDMLEEKGIVGPPNGSKPREVLVADAMELETLKAFEAHDDDTCPF